MANVKILKKKIKSTKSTLKITTAMKLVSAAKLNRAQQAALNARPYAKEIDDAVKTISALVSDYSHDFLKKSENKHTILLVISGHKGLCGSYNSQIVREARKFVRESGHDVKCYFIGKKARDILKNEVNQGKLYQFQKTDPTYKEVEGVAKELGEMFRTGEVGSIHVLYNHFRSAISFKAEVKKVLPFEQSKEEQDAVASKIAFDFKYEPNAKEILDDLIPMAYTNNIYAAILSAIAAEHGSRMTAMDAATKNCKEAIRKQTLKMNKMRQAKITTELIEVVSGAESLNG